MSIQLHDNRIDFPALMGNMSESPDYTGPLPQCEGPQLHPFDEHKGTVKFLRLISDLNSEGHAHVFEVSMGRKKYALKLVSKSLQQLQLLMYY